MSSAAHMLCVKQNLLTDIIGDFMATLISVGLLPLLGLLLAGLSALCAKTQVDSGLFCSRRVRVSLQTEEVQWMLAIVQHERRLLQGVLPSIVDSRLIYNSRWSQLCIVL